MYKTRKPTSRGLKIILIATCILFALFCVFVLLFGLFAANTNDADLKDGIGGVFSYHFQDIGDLFSFKFHDESQNILYYSLSGLLYFFIFIAILYLIVGILVAVKKKRGIVVPGIIASLLVAFVFLFVAGGTPKYWIIVNHRGAFENDNSLLGPTFGILACSALFILASYVLYFMGLIEAFKNPGLSEENLVENNSEKEAENLEEKPQENLEEKPVLFEAVDEEILQEEKPENQEEKIEAEEANSEEENMDNKEDLKELLREVVRDIVRDEIARNNANQPKADFNPNSGGSITGATFGGPLVVQYFNGGIQGMPTTSVPAPECKKDEAQPEEENAPIEEAPTPEEQPIEEPAPEEQPIEETAPEAPAEEPIAEPQPEQPVVPVEEQPVEEKKPIIRIPFTERMLSADKEMQDNYNELKNEILSYGVNSRVSNSGDTFRLHRKTYVKITIAGLSLKLYFALNPDDYKDSTLPIQNAGHKGIYEEIPLVFKVKSGLSMRRCKQLIQDVFDKNGFEQGEIANTNWVEELKNAPSDDSDDD